MKKTLLNMRDDWTFDLPDYFADATGAPTGSRYMFGTTDTDRDAVFKVKSLREAAEALSADGWDVQTEDPEYRDQNEAFPFITARKGEDNLIIYESWEAFQRFELATAMVKMYGLTSKKDRKTLFAVLLEAWPRRPDDGAWF